MRRHLAAALILALLFVLTACGSRQYVVTTKSGQAYTATSDLEYDMESQTYSFEDENGRQVRLNKEDVEVIKQK